MGIPFLGTFLTLSFFVIILGVIAYYLKKYNPINSNHLLKNRNIRILNRMALTPKANLFIITYENKVKLLGVSDNNITILDDMKDLNEEEIKNLIENQQIVTNFENLLKNKFKK